MPTAESRRSDESSVVDRLVRAADAVLRETGVDAVTIEAVAAAAGVSRATAFRQLGKRDDMVVAVGLLRAMGHAQECVDEMAGHTGTFAQIDAAFRYLVRKIPTDPVIREMLTLRTAAALDADVHDIATATLGPVFERGRRVGDVRTDVPVSEIITWTVEQFYLAFQQHDQSDRAISHRVLSFLAPALAPRPQADAAVQARIDVVASALTDAQHALSALRGG